MVIYWLMFAWPAAITFLTSGNRSRKGNRISLALLLVVFIILVGLRDNTGGDWINYSDYTEHVSFQSLGSALRGNSEAGFALITWLSTRIGWGPYGPSAFCAIVLLTAIIRFARHQPDSWLSITAAVPYLIIVVGMGYVRQAAAIGFIMLALLDFDQRKRFRCGIYIVLATLFHTSSLVILPFIAIIVARRNILYLIPILIGSIPAFYFLLGNRYNSMVENYINAQYDSSGALIRLLMNAFPSIIFLLNRKKFNLSEDMELLWTLFALASCFLVLGFSLSPSSTVVDRLGLYLIPIQLMVAGHIPDVLGRKPEDTRLISLFAVFYFALVQFVWLNYATNAFAWLPYHSLLTS